MNKFAIVGIGGKQFRVAEGDTITTEKVGEEGKTVKLNHVFLISDGAESKIGTPLVEGASVEAKVVSIKKAAKVRVFKMKPRARSRSEHGHRQWEATISILKING
ncbi:MAG: 50S ribosomal protein L21 [Candidatus Gracilibacteria bacterium]|nr:50S ribosomal protein L21 [Candidatus Gracilibacteria bacterium]MDD5179312.1 50S ribosomal protein L21 [Candidatus Gracilibacteria bacterium]